MADGRKRPLIRPPPKSKPMSKNVKFEINELVFIRRTNNPNSWWPVRVMRQNTYSVIGQSGTSSIQYKVEGIGPEEYTNGDVSPMSSDSDNRRPLFRLFVVDNQSETNPNIVHWHEFDRLAHNPIAPPPPRLLDVFRRDVVRGEAVRREQGSSSSSSAALPVAPTSLLEFIGGHIPQAWQDASRMNPGDLSASPAISEDRGEEAGRMVEEQRAHGGTHRGTYEKSPIPGPTVKNLSTRSARVSPKKKETVGSGKTSVRESPKPPAASHSKSQLRSPKKEGSVASGAGAVGKSPKSCGSSATTISQKSGSTPRKCSSCPLNILNKFCPCKQKQPSSPNKYSPKAKLTTPTEAKLDTEKSKRAQFERDVGKLRQATRRFRPGSHSHPRTPPKPTLPQPRDRQRIAGEGSDSTQPLHPNDQPMVGDSGNENDQEPLPGEEQQLDTPESDAIGVLEPGDLVFFRLTNAPNSWWPAEVLHRRHVPVNERRSRGEAGPNKFVYKLARVGFRMWKHEYQVPAMGNAELQRFYLEGARVGVDETSRIRPWDQFDRLASDPGAAPSPSVLQIFKRDLVRGDILMGQKSSTRHSNTNAGHAVSSSLLGNFIRGVTPPKWITAPTTSHTDPSMPDGAERQTISDDCAPAEASVQLVQPHSASKKSKPTSDLKKGTTPEVKNFSTSGARVSQEKEKTPGSGEASFRKSTESPGLTTATVSPKSRPPLPKNEETTGSTVPTSSPGSQLSSLRKSASDAGEAASKMSQPAQMKNSHSSRPITAELLESSLSSLRVSPSSGPSSTVASAPPKSSPVQSKQTQRFTSDKSSPKADLSTSKPSELEASTEKAKPVECGETKLDKLMEAAERSHIGSYSHPGPLPKPRLPSSQDQQRKKLGEAVKRFFIFDSHSRASTAPKATLPSSRDQQRTDDHSLNRRGREIPPVEVQDSGVPKEEANRASCHDEKADDVAGSAQIQPLLPSDQQMVVDDLMKGDSRERLLAKLQDSEISKEDANKAGCSDLEADPAGGSDLNQPVLPGDQQMLTDDSMNDHDREILPVEVQDSDVPNEEANTRAGCHETKTDPAEGSDSTQPLLPSDPQIIVDSGNGNDREASSGEEQELDILKEETIRAVAGDHGMDSEVSESPSRK